jgi:hypothetical protein
MSQIDGSWRIEVPSPMGTQVFVLDVKTDGATASGTVTGPDGAPIDILDPAVKGSELVFRIEITTPMALKITFTLNFNDDEVSGKIKAGVFPAAKAAGKRVKD